MNVLRALYKYLATVIFVAILVQVGAAGFGAFYTANKLKDNGDTLDHKGFDHGWSFHTGLGWLTIYATLLLLLVGLIARIGRPRIWWSLALAVTGVLQAIFAFLGEDHPGTGFLHPLNALAMFTLAGLIVHRLWHGRPPA